VQNYTEKPLSPDDLRLIFMRSPKRYSCWYIIKVHKWGTASVSVARSSSESGLGEAQHDHNPIHLRRGAGPGRFHLGEEVDREALRTANDKLTASLDADTWTTSVG